MRRQTQLPLSHRGLVDSDQHLNSSIYATTKKLNSNA
jgi:hypothetical protein